MMIYHMAIESVACTDNNTNDSELASTKMTYSIILKVTVYFDLVNSSKYVGLTGIHCNRQVQTTL